jgi:hypothetical protein
MTANSLSPLITLLLARFMAKISKFAREIKVILTRRETRSANPTEGTASESKGKTPSTTHGEWPWPTIKNLKASWYCYSVSSRHNGASRLGCQRVQSPDCTSPLFPYLLYIPKTFRVPRQPEVRRFVFFMLCRSAEISRRDLFFLLRFSWLGYLLISILHSTLSLYQAEIA